MLTEKIVMWQLADARSEARRLLEAHGPAALLGLSDAMSAAVRAGDHKAAERFEKILVQAEHELDGTLIPLSVWPVGARRPR